MNENGNYFSHIQEILVTIFICFSPKKFNFSIIALCS